MRNTPKTGLYLVLIKLILIFTIGFLIAHYLNSMIDRPSYLRLVTEGNPAGFTA